MEQERPGRFADPTIDFVFKRIFGTEQFKAATIGLLNGLIPGIDIVDVSFPNSELIGETYDGRKGYIDVLCTDTHGNNFVVEMQNARQEYFRERTIFYSSKIISRQAPVGEWDYHLAPTYVVAFLNFNLYRLCPDLNEKGIYMLHYTTTEEQLGAKLPGSTEYFYFGIPDFEKNEDELQAYPEKWIYLLRNSFTFTQIPESFKRDEAFIAYFDACERAGFSKEDEAKYVDAMMNEWDIANAKKLAVKEGRAEGRAEGLSAGRSESRLEIAGKMKSDNMPLASIMKYTGLSEEEVNAL